MCIYVYINTFEKLNKYIYRDIYIYICIYMYIYIYVYIHISGMFRGEPWRVGAARVRTGHSRVGACYGFCVSC